MKSTFFDLLVGFVKSILRIVLTVVITVAIALIGYMGLAIVYMKDDLKEWPQAGRLSLLGIVALGLLLSLFFSSRKKDGKDS